MRAKVNAKQLADFIMERARAHDGFLMGATGEYCRDVHTKHVLLDPYCKGMRHRAKYWIDRAERVWDSNGIIEGYYHDCTGMDIRTYTRINYANWCEHYRGEGMIPVQYRVPGAAVYWGETTNTIGQVSVLIVPVIPNKPDGDWYIGEAKSLMDGVVLSRLYARQPQFWGIMDKYFEYPDLGEDNLAPMLGSRDLKEGMSGVDVHDVQKFMWMQGFICEPTGIYDNETTAAVKGFQTKYFDDPAASTGCIDKQTLREIYNIQIKSSGLRAYTWGDTFHVNVRSGPGAYDVISTTPRSGYFDIIGEYDKWYRVKLNDYREGWVSKQFLKVRK